MNLILGSFFWGYICTEIPGGRLAEVIGTRRVFGYSMLISSFITLLTPLSATFGYTVVAALRIVLGFMLVRLPSISYRIVARARVRVPFARADNDLAGGS